MEFVTVLLVGAIMAYLIGSVPTAVWYGRYFHGIDVREHGSGNAGATNTLRVLGKKAGIIVMIIDIIKGWLGTSISLIFWHAGYLTEDNYVIAQIVFGIVSVVGHIFPLYAGFKGGKGVATLFGMVLAIHLPAALISTGVFLIVFIISRYVSLGSMLSALAFPVVLLIPFFRPESPILNVF